MCQFLNNVFRFAIIINRLSIFTGKKETPLRPIELTTLWFLINIHFNFKCYMWMWHYKTITSWQTTWTHKTQAWWRSTYTHNRNNTHTYKHTHTLTHKHTHTHSNIQTGTPTHAHAQTHTAMPSKEVVISPQKHTLID